MRKTVGILMAVAAMCRAGELRYTNDGQLVRPDDYREWVYLSSGLGMTYGPATAGMRPRSPMFDNVFVQPAAYRAFRETGRWPDKTMFILEVRSSSSHGSINQGGHFQTGVVAVEAAVKDEARFPDRWAYFGFNGPPGEPANTAAPLPKSASCYACHSANGAVDNTFTQFYPTLLEIAERKGTLNPNYKPGAASPAKLYHAASRQGWIAAEKLLGEAKEKDPEAAILDEPLLNQLGYQLLAAGKRSEAVDLLRWVTAANPQSANAWDSLADAYVANGQSEAALEASRKALGLLDANPALSPDRRQALADAIRKRIETLKK